jgi:hypothetical protein
MLRNWIAMATYCGQQARKGTLMAKTVSLEIKDGVDGGMSFTVEVPDECNVDTMSAQLGRQLIKYTDLGKDEKTLIRWLAREENSIFGECYGRALDKLVMQDLVEINGSGGWAQVTLTEKGLRHLRDNAI